MMDGYMRKEEREEDNGDVDKDEGVVLRAALLAMKCV